MGKQGPCYHCGVTSTPLWRNGPLDKPVLCNACGSRWRTKGTLLNYTPLHARADPVHCDDHGATRFKSISINKNNEVKLLKRKHASDNVIANAGVPLDYSLGSPKLGEEDISNRSSSGSAMSNSDLQFESADASDLTGPAQSVMWDTMVPSRKRTCVNRLKQSSVEKLTKDLNAIMHEQQSLSVSWSSEGDLLFESSTPMCSFEIGHGAVIFRDPGSVAREEESEASSLSVEQKQYKASVAYSSAEKLPPHSGGKRVNFRNPIPKTVKIKKPTEQGPGEEQLKRDISQHINLQILGNHNSALPTTNLRDVINIDEFMKQLTYEEEQQLLKYLPLGDNARLSDRLRSFFDSSEFKENLSAFPQLLAEGISGGSFLGAKVGDSKTLKKLTLVSLMRRKEVESNHSLEENKSNISSSSSAGLNMLHATASGNLVGGKRPRGVQNQNFSEARMMSPKRPSVKGTCEDKEPIDSDGSCFSPGNLFAFPLDGSVHMLDSSQLADENSDQDLLLDMPSNCSFPQAELLLPSLSFGSHSNQGSNSSSSVHHLPLPPH